MSISSQVDAFLLSRQGWVSASVLCEKFYLHPRELRASEGKPGICSNFAISGNAGFRHINCCTDAEWEAFRERLTAHGLAEIDRVTTLQSKRPQQPTQPTHEDYQQSLLFNA